MDYAPVSVSPASSEFDLDAKERELEEGGTRYGAEGDWCLAWRAASVFGLLLAGLSVGWFSAGGAGGTRDHRQFGQCNPYEQRGIIHVNTTHNASNRWEAVSAAPRCAPVDYLTALRSMSLAEPTTVDLEFARDRTLILLGDSVDRFHTLHFCDFINGDVETITGDHAASPPYPPGQEIGPPDYHNLVDGGREWEGESTGRPHVCTHRALGLRVMHIFTFGFNTSENWRGLKGYHHLYPPTGLEDRVDQIALPLLANLGLSTPAIISVTPGYWELQLRTLVNDRITNHLVEIGEKDESVLAQTNDWSAFDRSQVEWIRTRMTDVLNHIADAWPKATILWRVLHQPRPNHYVSEDRVQMLDQIGRHVVEKLRADPDVSSRRLAHRLKFDEWGAMMLGQQRHFQDVVHPAPLPGSWLYGNMLITQLKLAVEGGS